MISQERFEEFAKIAIEERKRLDEIETKLSKYGATYPALPNIKSVEEYNTHREEKLKIEGKLIDIKNILLAEGLPSGVGVQYEDYHIMCSDGYILVEKTSSKSDPMIYKPKVVLGS